jgi:signal peptidase I
MPQSCRESRTTDTNATRNEEKAASRRRTVVEYAVLALVAISVALMVQAFLVKPYRIPSPSMEDTLLIGDRVLVDRLTWRFSEPERGDIVVFHPPSGGNVLIKRIVGMPGDELSLRDGLLYVNGHALDEPYIRQTADGPEPTEPFLNGLAWGLTEPYVVPQGSYFMMGDNRTNSGDSRDFGPVARDQLVGQAFAMYWPPARIGGVD